MVYLKNAHLLSRPARTHVPCHSWPAAEPDAKVEGLLNSVHFGGQDRWLPSAAPDARRGIEPPVEAGSMKGRAERGRARVEPPAAGAYITDEEARAETGATTKLVVAQAVRVHRW